MSHCVVKIDFHEFSGTEARHALEDYWASRAWHGLRKVEIIHGDAMVLAPVVRNWCDEKGLPWKTLSHNPGVTILFPGKQSKTIMLPPVRPLSKLSTIKHELKTLKSDVAQPAITHQLQAPPEVQTPVQAKQSPPKPEIDLMALAFEQLEGIDKDETKTARLKSTCISSERSVPDGSSPFRALQELRDRLPEPRSPIGVKPVLVSKPSEPVDIFALEMDRMKIKRLDSDDN